MIKNKTIQIIPIILLIVFSLSLLTGCASKLPDGFDEVEVKSAAENVIMLLDQRNADDLSDLLTEQMKLGLTEDVLAQIFALLDEAGAVQTIEEMQTTGSTESSTTYGVVVAKVKHANHELTYTISFDSQMKLAGLYFK